MRTCSLRSHKSSAGTHTPGMSVGIAEGIDGSVFFRTHLDEGMHVYTCMYVHMSMHMPTHMLIHMSMANSPLFAAANASATWRGKRRWGGRKGDARAMCACVYMCEIA